MCFAAGVLITTPLMLALPEAVRRYPQAGFLALAGFLFMFFSNRVIRHLPTRRPWPSGSPPPRA